MSLPRSEIGWSVVVAFPGHTHLPVDPLLHDHDAFKIPCI